MGRGPVRNLFAVLENTVNNTGIVLENLDPIT